MDATLTARLSLISPARVFLAALFITIVIVALQYLTKAADDRSAFNRWRNQVQGLERKEDIYRRYQYPNAPIMALILYPLSHLPRLEIASAVVDLGALAWFLIKVGMTALAFWWTVQLLRDKDLPFPPWAMALALVLAIRPIIGDLSHGNVNLLILFLVTAALIAFRGGWDVSAGLLLALGICCKVTPGLFLPYFIWKRAWKTVAGCLLGLGLFFVVVPGAFLGQARNWELLNSWMDVMIWPYVRDGAVWTEHNNQSIPGVLYRLTTENPSFLDEHDRPLEFHNVVTLDPEAVRWLVKGCSLAFLLVMCWSCRTPTRPRANWRLAAEYAIILIGMLLFSERTWKHHCVTLLLPFAVLTFALATLRLSVRWRALIISSLIITILLQATASTTLWELLGNKMGAKIAQVYGVYMWGELLLVGVLVALLRKFRRVELEADQHALGSESTIQRLSMSPMRVTSAGIPLSPAPRVTLL